jgi:hypothetical protein
MITQIRFFKITEGPQRGWYADVPNHTLEENQMVAGCDVLLDKLNTLRGEPNEIQVDVSTKNEPRKFELELVRCSHDGEGASYIVSGRLADWFNVSGSEVWICNVAHDVFREHPKTIYIHRF